jgi:hypothetical protein
MSSETLAPATLGIDEPRDARHRPSVISVRELGKR